jgi:beta-glucosidase
VFVRKTPLIKAFIVILLGISATALAQTNLPYQNTALPIEQRVADLVSHMTLEEKVSQMQNTAPAIPRLNIPAYDWWSEALHGVARSGYATVFPQAIGMAASWDIDLIHHEADIISTEARAKFGDAIAHGNRTIYYGLDFWSPNINIFRDPRWGRGQETYGEDPYLTSRLGVAFVESMQGDDPRYFKAIATPKHYAVHSGPESERHKFNVDVAPYDLEDTYLPAFRATITEGHAYSIMCAYNAIDGTPACANTMLLQEHLRDAWKFPGYVTSDCGAVADISEGHKYEPDLQAASVAAVKAGTDTTCGTEYPTLIQAVKDHKIAEDDIDTAVRRLFTARFKLGLFDPRQNVSYAQIPFSENNTPEHRKAALEAAEKSIVLLKNDNRILPLQAGIANIAVIGPNAANLASIEGNYNGIPSAPVVPLTGLREYYAGKSNILYSQGSAFTSELPLVVPSTVFASDGEEGLQGEYFSSSDFSGTPVVKRTDSNLDFDWQSASPVEGLSATQYSVRWTGKIHAPGPGDYKFDFHDGDCYPCTGKNTIRVFVDEKPVFEQDGKDGSKTKPFAIHFDAGKSLPIRIEYSHAGTQRGGGIRLEWEPKAEALRDEAVAAAKQSDVVIAIVGLSPDLEGEEMPVHVEGFSGGDRTDIALPAVQRQLLEALYATGKPLVVVLMNGSALAIDWAKEHARAIVEAWYPGEEGGTAIARTLAGENNPGGRLPVTFYASVKDLPPFDEYSMKNRTYRYYKGEPLYPFGYGLSYSKFSYSDLKISPGQAKASGPVTVGVTVTNSGKVTGDEVVELYLTSPASGAGQTAPIRALKGFRRVTLEPGASANVDFALDSRDLSGVRTDGTRAVTSGKYKLSVGGSQPGGEATTLTGGFTVSGTRALPK